MTPETTTFNLADTFVALDDDCGARLLQVTASFWEDLTRGRLGHFSRLVSCFSFSESWATWEKHPAGDELVCLLSGEVTLVLEAEGGQKEITLDQPGQFVLIPADTWHTARVQNSCRMLFITPGEGTENRPV